MFKRYAKESFQLQLSPKFRIIPYYSEQHEPDYEDMHVSTCVFSWLFWQSRWYNVW